ncbi:MAG: DUF2145 domain-containing protein [Rhodoferax sp.]|nr:DUF2145 domain-containing protein [Rhodoferax sp.]
MPGTVSWTAAPSPASLRSTIRSTVLCCAWFAAVTAHASSLNYCQPNAEPTAAVQDRLIQVAAIVKQTLDGSGQTLALVSRSGLALQRLGQRYSHAGVSLKASPNTPWSVRQLYYACDAQRPKIFDQGMSGFVLGAEDPAEGYLSIVLLPPEGAAALERAALDERQALQLLSANYSANAYAFSQRYQNCNQWVAELLAAAWSTFTPETSPDTEPTSRSRAQRWLQAEGYLPTVLRVGWQPLMWLARQLPWLHSDDHPQEDLAAAQFRVSMPQSIELFVRARWPDAQRIEVCYTESHVVVRRGWEPIADGCIATEGDEVRPLLGDKHR